LNALPEELRRAFTPGDDFQPVPRPGAVDWLAVHEEPGQTFEEFVASRPNKPDTRRHIVYLEPLGQFPVGQAPSLDKLIEYASAFFQMETRSLPPLDLAIERLTTRTNAVTHKRQLLTGDVLRSLARRVPADAFCLLAITMEDLYPEESWNFVFGQASLRERVGVYSFARYDPALFGLERPDDFDKLILRRSCKVLAHETAHMFGMLHCVYFDCLANGSNHLRESDRRPMHICPICLRKLHSSIGFSVVKRYADLEKFCRKAGFSDEAQWLERQLKKLKP
jgi:archaemetzincin